MERAHRQVTEKLAASVGGDLSASASTLSLPSSVASTDTVAAAKELERLQAEKADVRRCAPAPHAHVLSSSSSSHVLSSSSPSRVLSSSSCSFGRAVYRHQMQEELNQQSLLQMTLQAKIDHLTKVILTSTSVSAAAAAATATPQVGRAGRRPWFWGLSFSAPDNQVLALCVHACVRACARSPAEGSTGVRQPGDGAPAERPSAGGRRCAARRRAPGQAGPSANRVGARPRHPPVGPAWGVRGG